MPPTLLSIRERLHFRAIVVVGPGPEHAAALREREVLAFGDVLALGKPHPFVAPTLSDEVAFWMYTSGSTGDPKAVKHVHTSLMATARLMGQGVIGIRADDVMFSASKLPFSYGLGNTMSFPMSVGASAVLMYDRPTAQSVLATLRAIVRRSSAPCRRSTRRCWRIRRSARAPAPTGCGCASRRARRCPLISASAGSDRRRRILDGIGSTEMLQTFLSNRPGDVRYGSTGKPVPATRSRSSTSTAARSPMARSVN